MTQSTVNLVKNIVGSGMLSLPAGIAAFSGSPTALAPAMAFALGLALLSAYGFVLVGDACNMSGESTYQGAWAKTVGPRTKFLPAIACLAKSAIACIAYLMIFGDCLSAILPIFGVPAALASRSASIVGLTAVVLLPLCSMKSLAPLAKFSVAGVLSNVYISFFVVLRCLDGTYRAGGAFYRAAPAKPLFEAASAAGAGWGAVAHPGFAVLLSILATAYLAHYNAPLFYEQLAPGPDGEKGSRFLTMSVLGFGVSALIFAIVMAGGFLTFGKASMGLVLNNYAATDTLALLARIAILVSLITTYPIVFLSLRKQVISMFGPSAERFNTEQPGTMTVTLLAAVVLVALNLRDLGRLSAFAGACFGSFLIYVAPAAMVLAGRRKGLARTKGSVLGRVVQHFLIPLGLVLAWLGAVQSLK